MINLKKSTSLLLSLLLGLFSGCTNGTNSMKAEQFFEPQMVALLAAIQRGKTTQAQQLIDQGVELNIHGNEDITPLLWLVMEKDKAAVKLALTLGADPNFQRANGSNAVTMMAGGKDPEWLELLLAAGGDPNSIDHNGMPAIFDAIGQERWADIHTLLKYGADVNLRDASGRNCALYPTYIGLYEFAYFFIQQGADPHVYASTGANLAWKVYDNVNRGILAPDNRQYPWAMKIKQHLIEQGVSFPPPSPAQVRERWEREGKPD